MGVLSTPPYGATVPGNAWDEAADLPAPRRTVSVVVTHFEQPRQLARTLHALRHQTRRPDEVVVADDGSREPPEVGPGVTLVRQEDRGFRAAAARNLGASRCTGDVLVLLDADTTPEPDVVERLVALPSRLPELLAVGRRRHADLARAGPDEPVSVAGPARELAEPAWLRDAYAATGDLRHADHASYRFVISAILACSRWWFEELGGFDETFVGYGGEDWELAHRSWLRGGLLAHVPGAVAWHDGPAVGEAGATDRTPSERLGETLAVAARVGAPGGGFRGLLRGPADLVVTLGPGLDEAGVAVTADSLLSALPRSHVVLAEEAAAARFADPRVTHGAVVDPLPWLTSEHRLRLELDRPVVGGVTDWAAVIALAGVPDPPATTTLVGADGSALGRLHDLRQHRRAARWPSYASTVLRATRSRVTLRDATGTTLQAWLEGW